MKFQNNILFALLSLSSVAVNEKSSLSIFVSADTNSSVCQSILDSNPKASACVEAASGTAFFGKLQTNDDGIKVDAFKGIKYADFQNRFDPSEVLAVQDGDKINATEFGAACAQPPGEIPTGSLEEHCLNLNIWKPINAEEDGAGDLLPVMVYIHGGAFNTGTNSLARYNGANIVGNENVVVVSINYRLGVFGYMPTDSKGTGTMNGILDQIEALRWVQNNIEMFGGDPKLVTIFGESAGAGSVVMLSVIPRAKGLFQRAIGQSANDGRPYKYVYLDDVLNGTKCPEPSCTISYLKDMPAEELMTATASFRFSPYFDPAVLPAISSILYSEGAINPTDMIVGSNTFDDTIVTLLGPSDYIAMAEGGIEKGWLGFDSFNITTPDEIEAALDAYSWDKFNGSSVLASAQYAGDVSFTCPLRDIAVSAATSGFDGKMFVYHFGHLSKYDAVSQNGLVTAANITDPTFTSHGAELPFVFGYTVGYTVGELEENDIPFSDKEKKLSREMMSRWASFARSGNPNLSDELDNEWFPVSTSNAPGIVAADPRYMRFTIDGGVMVESDKDKMEQCAAVLLNNPLFDHANKNDDTAGSNGSYLSTAYLFEYLTASTALFLLMVNL